MFVKKSWNTYKGKRYESYHIAEGYWDSDKQQARHRYVLNISSLPKHVIESIDLALKQGETADVLFSPAEFEELVIEEPRVWWPNPLGPQEMYELTLTVEVDDEVSEQVVVPFGIREATTYIGPGGRRKRPAL